MSQARHLLCALLTGVLALCSPACATPVDAGADEPATAPEPSYDYASVPYGPWRVDFAPGQVVWSPDDASDVLVVAARITYAGTRDDARFADVESFQAFPAETVAPRARLERAQGSGTDGTPFADTAAEGTVTAPGASLEATYAWLLDGHYGDIRVDLQGFSASPDDTSVTFSGIEQTAERAAYEAQAEAQRAERAAAGEADLGGAVVVRPDGWRFLDIGADTVTLAREDDEGVRVRVSYLGYVTDTPAARARRYTDSYGEDAPTVETMVLGSNAWAYLAPVPGRCMGWTQASVGIVEVSGSGADWDGVADVAAGVSVR